MEGRTKMDENVAKFSEKMKELLALAKKKKAFNRSFNMEVEEAFYDELIAYVDHKVKRRELGLE